MMELLCIKICLLFREQRTVEQKLYKTFGKRVMKMEEYDLQEYRQ
jgi:hypothetical protein